MSWSGIIISIIVIIHWFIVLICTSCLISRVCIIRGIFIICRVCIIRFVCCICRRIYWICCFREDINNNLCFLTELFCGCILMNKYISASEFSFSILISSYWFCSYESFGNMTKAWYNIKSFISNF